MLTLRLAQDRGHADHGWLRSAHTFSFAGYHDPAHMGFRALRVINDDTVLPGRGFGTHGHRDMEILTYVLDGALQHRDSLGNGSIIRPGEVQRMSAGTGVTHSEMNASQEQPVHFLQIWIVPDRAGHPPGYEQTLFSEASRRGTLRLVASPDGQDGSVTVHQDARLWATLLDGDAAVSHTLDPRRFAWVHVARGSVQVNGQRLGPGDAAAVAGADLPDGRITLDAGEGAEVLLFDLA